MIHSKIDNIIDELYFIVDDIRNDRLPRIDDVILRQDLKKDLRRITLELNFLNNIKKSIEFIEIKNKNFCHVDRK